MVFQSNILDEIFDETLHIVLRSWHPTSTWVDSAKILISVRSISIDSTVKPTGVDMCDTSGGADRDFMVFRLEPVPGGDSFQTVDVSTMGVFLARVGSFLAEKNFMMWSAIRINTPRSMFPVPVVCFMSKTALFFFPPCRIS